mgnify:CR=1 FL=1
MKRVTYLLFLVALLISSCSKDSNNDPPSGIDELYGAWIHETLGDEPGIPDQKFNLVFTESNVGDDLYEFYWSATDSLGVYFVVACEAGTFTAVGDLLFGEADRVGGQWDPFNDILHDTIVWYYPGDPIFDLYDTFESVGYELVDDDLLIKSDDNENGVFDDDEITLYRRE